MSFNKTIIKDQTAIITGNILLLAVLLTGGCSGLQTEQVAGSAVRVAKVDTEYVYEANIDRYIGDFRQSGRTRISTFIGFSPDDILIARELAIEDEIRKEIKRLPGINISPRDVRELAKVQMEELAYELHERLTVQREDFAAIAHEYSTGDYSHQGGAIPSFGIRENPELYQVTAYGMEIGEISEPFENYEGWRIIKLDDVTEDAYEGTQYHISMILLTADLARAEDTIIDEHAEGHTIEILDPKYNSRRALIDEDFEKALDMADEAINMHGDDELAHYLRARALWELDRQDEAFEELETASEVGKISDAMIPYYHFFRGEYYEELGQTENAIQAYHVCFDSWRQDISLAYALEETFSEFGDEEYLAIIREEIDIIQSQDASVLWLRGSDSRSGVIATGEGQVEGNTAEYEEGFRE